MLCDTAKIKRIIDSTNFASNSYLLLIVCYRSYLSQTLIFNDVTFSVKMVLFK